jgi:hypothetical protein
MLWTQPAMAEDQPPTKPIITFANLPYPASGQDRIIQLIALSDYTYLSTGPLYTSEGFRYAWICPAGASLIDNACYAKSESGGSANLVDPIAAQVAFGYDQDTDGSTNEQLIIVSTILSPEDENSIIQSFVNVQNATGCRNPRGCVVSICANRKTVTPPTACPR